MDFKGFTTDSFEQLIHALSLHVFGDGVAVFGNGPDGGREATFNGKVKYPSNNDSSWNGYGVIQAKYKERIESRDKDFQWAKSQLEKELEQWKTSSKREPKPDYFIFCINVELTSASGGGKDTLNQLLENYKTDLGLVGYAIWDRDKLAALIDCYHEIRQRFSAFFTSGDLLAVIAQRLDFETDVTHALMSYVRHELTAEKDAKVSQAGDRTGEAPSLADVFVDLPSSSVSVKEQDGNSVYSSMPELLAASGCNLDPTSLDKKTIHPYSSQYVFIGGPGSGKSTIGQFLSQIHRAAILDRMPSSKNTEVVKKTIKAIQERCRAEKFVWPSTPRYPFRIDLNQYAKSLATESAKGGIDTLSQYIRIKISQDEEITHRQLLSWFESFPCLLIFDGLDEVPTSANREDVIQSIQRFLGDIRAKDADVLVIASSRPDGYRNEFDEEGVCYKYLLALTKEQSLKCANSYVVARYGNNCTKVTEERGKLKEALENPLVEKLMQSPLQITFMVTVLDSHGAPSESRWQLFDDYYRTIYAREKQKAVPPFDSVLNKRRPVVDLLHHNAGFVLQARAEVEQTNAELPIEEFSNMAEKLLKACGIENEELQQELTLIKGAANERLVFLTSKRPDLLSFDVRSLQEYMAAMALTKGSAETIIERMRSIALSDYWRNTLLFAIGRFFYDSHFFEERDRIRILCDDLNIGDCQDVAVSVKPGSMLALEILESGTVGNSPIFVQGLTSMALELLDFLPNEMNLPKRLAEIASVTVKPQFKEFVEIRLGHRELSKTLSTWLLCGYLRKLEFGWFDEVTQKYWPEEAQVKRTIIELLVSHNISTEEEKLELAMIYLAEHPANVPLSNTVSQTASAGVLGELLRMQENRSSSANRSNNLLGTGMQLGFSTVFGQQGQINIPVIEQLISNASNEGANQVHMGWNLLLDINRFIDAPSLKGLKVAANSLVKNKDPKLEKITSSISSWLLTYQKNYFDINGKLPDLGIEEKDFLNFCESVEIDFRDKDFEIHELLDSDSFNILVLGKNVSVSSYNGEVANINTILGKLFNLPGWKSLISSILFYCSCNSSELRKIDSLALSQLMQSFNEELYLIYVPAPPPDLFDNPERLNEWSSIYDNLCRCISPQYFEPGNVHSNNVNDFNNLLKLDWVNYPKLIELISYFVAVGALAEIDSQFIEKVKPHCQSEICFLIFEMSINVDSMWVEEHFLDIIKRASTDEKYLLLSFLANNKENSMRWIKILSCFIGGLEENETKLKGMAQKLHIELVRSLPSSIDSNSIVAG